MTGLADALRAEYAAIYGYGVVGAHLSKRLAKAGRQAEEAHRSRRDALLERLVATSVTPPPAEPGYPLPFPVTDPASAVKLAIHLEERSASVWRAVLSATTGSDRHLALDALVDCAVWASRWRTAAKTPSTVAFPGIPRR